MACAYEQAVTAHRDPDTVGENDLASSGAPQVTAAVAPSAPHGPSFAGLNIHPSWNSPSSHFPVRRFGISQPSRDAARNAGEPYGIIFALRLGCRMAAHSGTPGKPKPKSKLRHKTKDKNRPLLEPAPTWARMQLQASQEPRAYHTPARAARQRSGAPLHHPPTPRAHTHHHRT